MRLFLAMTSRPVLPGWPPHRPAFCATALPAEARMRPIGTLVPCGVIATEAATPPRCRPGPPESGTSRRHRVRTGYRNSVISTSGTRPIGMQNRPPVSMPSACGRAPYPPAIGSMMIDRNGGGLFAAFVEARDHQREHHAAAHARVGAVDDARLRVGAGESNVRWSPDFVVLTVILCRLRSPSRDWSW